MSEPRTDDETQQPTICPRCKNVVPSVVTLTHAARGIVYQGCSNCLIAELDVLSTMRSGQCSVCGALKVPILFQATGVQRLECPTHVHGRSLLAQALPLLDRLEGDEEADKLREAICQTMGIRLP